MTRLLHPAVSFRIYPDFTILTHHRTGRWMRLNRAAGEILLRLDEDGPTSEDDDSPFFAALCKEQIVVTQEEAEADLRAVLAVQVEDVGKYDSPSRHARSATPSRLLDDLNDYATRNLIALHAHIALTHRCPLHCKHCYLAGSVTRPDEELSTARLREVIDELAALGSYFLAFTGGEPALRDDLEDLVRHARSRRFAVALFTSGFGMNPDRWRTLAALGLDGVQVSIHGPDAVSHDDFTGVHGSFHAAMDSLRLASRLGIPVRAAVTLHKENAALAGEILALLEREGLAWNMGLTLWPRLNGDRSPCALQLEEDEQEPLLELRSPRRRFRMAKLGAGDPPCAAGRNTLTIDAKGNVQPCTAWTCSAGNVRDTPLAAIWRDSPVFADVRSLTVADLEGCAGCDWRETCNRCTGLAVLEGKAPTGHSLLDCRQARYYAQKRR